MFSLRTAMLTSLTLLILPSASLSVALLFMWSQSERRSAQNQAESDARGVTQSLEAVIEETDRVLDGLIRAPGVDWEDTQGLLARFETTRGAFPFSRGVSMVDDRGRVVTKDAASPSLSVADRSWYQETLRSRAFTIGEFVYSRVTGAPSLPLARPIEVGGKHIGVLGMSIDMNWFDRQVRGYTTLRGSTITLIANDGTILVRFPEPGAHIGRPSDEPFVSSHAQLGTREVAMVEGQDGINRLLLVQPLMVKDHRVATIAMSIPESLIHGETQMMGNWLLFGLFLTVGLSLVIVAVVLRTVVFRPVMALARHTEQLASGHFERRLRGKALPEELSPLVTAINTMAQTLEKRDNELSTYRLSLEEMVASRTADLEASKKDLQRSNDELQQFAYVASHDLQEPLRMVASFTQLIEKRYGSVLDDEGHRYIRFAVDGATRMQQLINDLLKFSRVDAHNRSLGKVMAKHAVDQALSDLHLLLEEKGAQVEVAPLPTVVSDLGQLSQVFQNLIGNAIKFNEATPPRVRVFGEAKGRFAEFCVEDNGIGIAPEYHSQVFVIFQRLNPRDRFGGTGIGLALCKRIIERQGGTIWIESGESQGTRLRFTLPLCFEEDTHE